LSAGWLLLLVPVGAAVGMVSAAFGIGGGVMMVPVMVLGYGLDQHAAQGTSLMVIVPTALAGVVAHHRRGFVELPYALWMALGGVVGVYGGAQLALAVDGELLRRLFGFVVVASGIRLVIQGRSARRHEQGADDELS
jgi:uncharacterized protein